MFHAVYYPINNKNNQGEMYNVFFQMIASKISTGTNIVEWSLWKSGWDVFVERSLKNEQRKFNIVEWKVTKMMIEDQLWLWVMLYVLIT